MEAILSRHCSPIEALRRRIEGKIWSVTRTSTGHLIDLSTPHGDPGLFGPAAVCWQVHDDFPTMLVGGIRALMLQALHPLALAGVLEHSIYRQDMRGRLARTAQFVAGTTYGSVRDAHGLIVHVNGIHRGYCRRQCRWTSLHRHGPCPASMGACGRSFELSRCPPAQRESAAGACGPGSISGGNGHGRAIVGRDRRAGDAGRAESVHPGTAWRTGGQPPPARSHFAACHASRCQLRRATGHADLRRRRHPPAAAVGQRHGGRSIDAIRSRMD